MISNTDRMELLLDAVRDHLSREGQIRLGLGGRYGLPGITDVWVARNAFFLSMEKRAQNEVLDPLEDMLPEFKACLSSVNRLRRSLETNTSDAESLDYGDFLEVLSHDSEILKPFRTKFEPWIKGINLGNDLWIFDAFLVTLSNWLRYPSQLEARRLVYYGTDISYYNETYQEADPRRHLSTIDVMEPSIVSQVLTDFAINYSKERKDDVREHAEALRTIWNVRTSGERKHATIRIPYYNPLTVDPKQHLCQCEEIIRSYQAEMDKAFEVVHGTMESPVMTLQKFDWLVDNYVKGITQECIADRDWVVRENVSARIREAAESMELTRKGFAPLELTRRWR